MTRLFRRRIALWPLPFVPAALAGCATGVDITDEQLAELENAVEAQLSGNSPPRIANGSNASGDQPGQTTSTPLGGSGGAGGFDDSQTVIPSPPLTGGTCSGAAAPIAVGECANGPLSVLYTDRSDGPDNNQLTMVLSLQNTGADFALSDLVIRYWFTADGQSDFTADIDYASVQGVCVNFGDQLGSGFADIGFASSDTVSGDGVDQVQVRIHTGNFGALNQSNDFSFLPGANAEPNENIAVYVQGILVAGCEPQ